MYEINYGINDRILSEYRAVIQLELGANTRAINFMGAWHVWNMYSERAPTRTKVHMNDRPNMCGG